MAGGRPLTWDLSWTTADGRDRTPVIPAHEMSGTVTVLGDGVTTVAVGDEVFGLVGFDRNGAAAGFTTIPAADLAARPRSASHALAALLGGEVTATGRDRDAEFILGLGAAEFVSAAAPAAQPEFDVVIDTVGGAVLAGSYGLLRPGGRLVTLGAPPDAERAQAAGVHAMFFVVAPDPGELAYLAELTDAGRLRPVVSQTFPLAEGRAAFGTAGRPRPPGKTVLTVAADHAYRRSGASSRQQATSTGSTPERRP